MSPSLKSLRFAYGGLSVLDGIDMDFLEGGINVILGPSGCGKTTLLNLVAGLLAQDEGRREGFEGQVFSYAFQEPRLLPWLTARANAAFALSGLMPAADAEARIGPLLAAAGLAEAADQRPEALSGGMKQRLSLVRAFAYPADVLLLDEAFTAVDLRTRIDLMDVFLRLWAAARPTVISVTHDVEEAAYLADRVFILSSRPARVKEAFDIGVARAQRSLGSAATMEAEARLYRLVLAP